MTKTWRRAALCAITLPTALAVLSGCSSNGTVTVSGTAGPAGGAATPTATATATGDRTATPTEGAGSSTTPAGSAGSGGDSGSGSGSKGCTAGGAALPKGADLAPAADLDGDGRTDSIWLADRGDTRILGVKTAGGARFSTSFTNAAPTSASAVAGRLGDGTAVILLDFSRSATVYAVVDCAIVKTINAQGKQYTFDEGFTGYGSGAGCPVIGSGRHLVGYLAKGNSAGDAFTVTRTTVNLSKNGTRASNGTVATLGQGLPGSSAIVKKAQDVACGTGDRASEPAS